jgi:hypothetical protein
VATGGGRAVTRATITVVALYALLLQAFIGTLAGAGFTQAHGIAVLCAPADPDGAPAERGPCSHCVVACSPTFGPVPDRTGDGLGAADCASASSPIRDATASAQPSRTQRGAHGARAPPFV